MPDTPRSHNEHSVVVLQGKGSQGSALAHELSQQLSHLHDQMIESLSKKVRKSLPTRAKLQMTSQLDLNAYSHIISYGKHHIYALCFTDTGWL